MFKMLACGASVGVHTMVGQFSVRGGPHEGAVSWRAKLPTTTLKICPRVATLFVTNHDSTC